jgi:hypothetical protein
MTKRNENYRLCVVRRAPLAAPSDLTATLDWLVRKLEQEDPVVFALRGYSPARAEVAVIDGETSRVEGFLELSEIKWHFGRDPEHPTHEVALFNPAKEAAGQVYLRVSFVANGEASTGPGLVAELRLGRDAAGPEGPERGVHLDKLFSLLIVALHPDFGHIELPGHPRGDARPMAPDVGWITYLARPERALPKELPPPAMAAPTERGTKIYATPSVGLHNHGDIARDIERVREALDIRPREEPAEPAEPAQPDESAEPVEPEESAPEPAWSYVQPPSLVAQPADPGPPERTLLDMSGGASRSATLPFAALMSSGPSREPSREATPFLPAEPEPESVDPDDIDIEGDPEARTLLKMSPEAARSATLPFAAASTPSEPGREASREATPFRPAEPPPAKDDPDPSDRGRR